MGSWWNRRNEDAALEKELRALRHDPPGRLVRSVRDQVKGTPSWARPKVRYALVAVMTAAVLAGAASANMINVATSTTTRAVQIIHHLSGSTTSSHSSKVVITHVRQTPAQAQYVIGSPKVSITKAPASQSVTSGGTATFTITVTNTGTEDLTNVKVSDPKSPKCNKTIGKLAVGASAHYTCTLTNVKASFTNVATVNGTGADGPAADQGTADVNVPAAAALTPVAVPGIKVTKSPSSQTVTTKVDETKSSTGSKVTSVTYGTAHFTIKVTNTGNTVLNNVTVKDAYTVGCDHSVSSLAAGHSITYTCKGLATSTFTNVAVASGQPPKGARVSAQGTANVTVKTVTTTKVAAAEFTG